MPRVLMVGAEAAPFVKTGGLGDVLGSLPAALVERGDEVAVTLPRYRVAAVPSAQRVLTIPLTLGTHSFTAAIDEAVHNGVRYFFVDCPPLYDRSGIYGAAGSDYPDNHIRFGLLNLAAIAIARHIFRTDIFHGHDWQAGLLAPYLRTLFSGDPTFFGAKCILTIHNLGYQGIFPRTALDDLGLDRALFHPAGIAFFGQVSFLKSGIVWSDAITTVSPTYAKEIQTPELGSGLDDLLRSRAASITGILNGADYGAWNPENDPFIQAHFSADNLSGKRISKRALLEEMDLPVKIDRPLIGITSRLVEQKGFELLAGAAAELFQENVALVALGSGEPRLEHMFRDFAVAWPDKFAVRIGFDNALAHRIEAGSDMFLMPSRYEPCGLSQMYSLRYGTVPIVRATGGLEDSVDNETGFKFRDYTPAALAGAVAAALEAWQDQKGWLVRMRRGMAKDFSWNASAARYRELYKALQLHPQGGIQHHK